MTELLHFYNNKGRSRITGTALPFSFQCDVSLFSKR
ncbi:hypothetical protein BACOVA_03751 [Bacteroides ovatus ATCC 8483]|uniref:Uncharacterized protein n=1 Tax=Bacteroides ovatus (strain ATCC 8483 / DSM 1896 / JCM 5824 / BCRC 10623 / CCUG 4943 / NCTC 11153) TaxID=411476 RepID=A0AAN3A6U1_BACO1|nr:hypothetical protein BACOVA_03751 [Bacteroides ovatus ATCC 8483]